MRAADFNAVCPRASFRPRSFLFSVFSREVFAHRRAFFTNPVLRSMARKISKSEAEWKADLSPEQDRVLRKKAPNRRFPAPGAIIRTQDLMSARPVVSRFSTPTPNTIPVADGPVFTSRLMETPSKRKKTAVWGWCVRRCCVPGAIRTSGMCSKMARIPPGCGIASIPRRSILKTMQSEGYGESAFAESSGWRC